MYRILVVPLVVFTVFLLQSSAMAQPAEERSLASEAKPDLMGMPYDDAIAFITNDTAALRDLPGVEQVSVGVDGIYVSTDEPGRVPATFKGIPVKTVPPMQPRIQGRSHAEVNAILGRAQRDLVHLPGVQEVTLGFDGLYVFTDQPDLIPTEMEGLPVKTLPFMGAEIKDIPGVPDIPASEVDAIFWRNWETLRELPGAYEVSLGTDGIYVSTDQPDELPDEVEGLPVKPIKIPASARP